MHVINPGWYVLRFEIYEPRVMYRRKRGCVCVRCVEGEYDECQLTGLPGGPGDWERVNITRLAPRGVALERKNRDVDLETFLGRLRSGVFIAVKLQDEFMGRYR